MSIAKSTVYRCNGCRRETDDPFDWWIAQRPTHTKSVSASGNSSFTTLHFCDDCAGIRLLVGQDRQVAPEKP